MIDTKDYIEVTLDISPYTTENAEIVEAELAELPYNSFMDGTDVDGKPVLKAYIQQSDYNPRSLRLALDGVGFVVKFKADIVQAMNWNAQWESRFQPVVVDGRVTIKAPFNKNLKKTRFNITIDPQMAFGTGWHQTTFMMMQSMLEQEDEIKDKSVMDLGCGTALLGILAAKMRAMKVYGIDIDAVAAQSGFDNARRNKVLGRMEIYCGDASLLQMESYDVLLANIHKNVILQDLHTYSFALRKAGMRYDTGLSSGGLLLLSGFYDCDVPDILAAAEKENFELLSQKSKDNWSCLTLRKRP